MIAACCSSVASFARVVALGSAVGLVLDEEDELLLLLDDAEPEGVGVGDAGSAAIISTSMSSKSSSAI
jgi:hypothetical protein